MKMTIVIPAYTKTQKQFQMLFTDCIDSFIKHHGADHEIIVVEDAGPMSAAVEAECVNRGIRSIINEVNCGFSKSVNKGIRESNSEIVVLVNNDVQFTQRIDQQLEASFASNERIGIVGALLLYPHGTIQHGGIMMVGRGFTHRGWHKTLGQSPEVHVPGFMIGVTGALFAMRRQMFEEIGLLKEDYFLSCEDTEYCLRAWTRDWLVYYNPDVRAIHAEGTTRGRTDMDKIQHHRTWYQKEMETWGKFQKDLVGYDLNKIQAKMQKANIDVGGGGMTEMGADRMVFEGGAVGSSLEKKPETILVRRTGAFGDVLMATPVIRELKKQYPGSQIIFATICPDALKFNPNISQIVRGPDGIKVDRFYDLDMAYEMRPKMPVWQAYSQAVFGTTTIDPALDLHSSVVDGDTLRKKLGSISLEKDKVAVFHMGVSWGNRTWMRNRWLEVVGKMSAAGFKVIVVGKGADFRAEMAPGVLNLVDYLGIGEIRELCRSASVFAGVDSGILHVAQTTDIPIVGLFTVANPVNRIVPRSSRTIALIPRSECRFCLHEQTPPVTYVECKYGDNHCLIEITSDDVVKAMLEIAK